MSKQDVIAVINAGSSSIKFQIFTEDGNYGVLYEGLIEGINTPKTARTYKDADGNKVFEDVREDRTYDHKELTMDLLTWLNEQPITIVSAGHRVVHGGQKYSSATKVSPEVVQYLKDVTMPMAPNHAPANIAPIEALMDAFPDLPQVLSFDTAFHRTNPDIIAEYAIDPKYTNDGVMSYGFHGISYHFIAEEAHKHLGETAKGKLIVAHLGNGASMCAIENGKSIDTTMGFTPLDGLMMGTRTGTIDPGALLYMIRKYDLSLDEAETIISKKSGTLAVSELDSDMRPVTAAYDSNPSCKKAVDMFNLRVAHYFGKLMVSIQGCDALIFTAGIGENAIDQRAQIVKNLEFMGLKIDAQANDVRGKPTKISAADSSIPIWIIPTNEELMIAHEVHDTLS